MDPFLCIPGGMSDVGSDDQGLCDGPSPIDGFGDWKKKLYIQLQT